MSYNILLFEDFFDDVNVDLNDDTLTEHISETFDYMFSYRIVCDVNDEAKCIEIINTLSSQIKNFMDTCFDSCSDVRNSITDNYGKPITSYDKTVKIKFYCGISGRINFNDYMLMVRFYLTKLISYNESLSSPLISIFKYISDDIEDYKTVAAEYSMISTMDINDIHIHKNASFILKPYSLDNYINHFKKYDDGIGHYITNVQWLKSKKRQTLVKENIIVPAGLFDDNTCFYNDDDKRPLIELYTYDTYNCLFNYVMEPDNMNVFMDVSDKYKLMNKALKIINEKQHTADMYFNKLNFGGAVTIAFKDMFRINDMDYKINLVFRLIQEPNTQKPSDLIGYEKQIFKLRQLGLPIDIAWLISSNMQPESFSKELNKMIKDQK